MSGNVHGDIDKPEASLQVSNLSHHLWLVKGIWLSYELLL